MYKRTGLLNNDVSADRKDDILLLRVMKIVNKHKFVEKYIAQIKWDSNYGEAVMSAHLLSLKKVLDQYPKALHTPLF